MPIDGDRLAMTPRSGAHHSLPVPKSPIRLQPEGRAVAGLIARQDNRKMEPGYRAVVPSGFCGHGARHEKAVWEREQVGRGFVAAGITGIPGGADFEMYGSRQRMGIAAGSDHAR